MCVPHTSSDAIRAEFRARQRLVESLVERLCDAGGGGDTARNDRFAPLLPVEVRRLAAKWTNAELTALLSRDPNDACVFGYFGKRKGCSYFKRARPRPYDRGKPRHETTRSVAVRDLMYMYLNERPLMEGERLVATCGGGIKCCNPWHHRIKGGSGGGLNIGVMSDDT